MHVVLADERIAPYEIQLGRSVVRRAADEVFGRARASLADHDIRRHRRRTPRAVAEVAPGDVDDRNQRDGRHSSHEPRPCPAVGKGPSRSRGRHAGLLEPRIRPGDAASAARATRMLRPLLRRLPARKMLWSSTTVPPRCLLVLDTFAKGREVVVARNQLVEIGGGFRIPDVLERSGATLVEVGTTNRVYIEDYERALSPRTALLLRTHPSNYRIAGFTNEPSPRELVELGHGAPALRSSKTSAAARSSILARYGVGARAHRPGGDRRRDRARNVFGRQAAGRPASRHRGGYDATRRAAQE